ncbi:MAG: ABC transporter ATP-binding protein [Nitrospinae bacterium]|nr:ABC transporter ATP-binding protein [Nitrospinota bacterium]
MAHPLAELKEVSKTYLAGDALIHALKDVSFRAEQGEFITVSGPSGSGKSTFLHLMGAVDAPTSGQVFLGGREISRLSDEGLSEIRRNEVGFIHQFFHLMPTMTAYENIALPLVLQGQKRPEIKEMAENALARVGLANRMRSYPRQLSGGEMQRVAVARAIIHKPRLILADEPTGNLDTENSQNVLELISELHEEDGFTVVMATHDQMPLRYATRRVGITDGRLEGGC